MTMQLVARFALRRAVSSLLLLVLVWSTYVQQPPLFCAAKRVVCFHNLPQNPRTASLFERGTLNRYSSQFLYVMDYRATALGLACEFDVNLVESNHNSEAVRA
eukprot:INCI3194.1.p1 GENE.INCI3194.1~~INCI3194.1.p1  ORF type:complete len:103 (-),score=11.54 INCI3194.1:8-316(-)